MTAEKRSASDESVKRTSSRFENVRYWLMWRIAPVSKTTIAESLKDDVETWDESEYDSVRIVGHLLSLWDDHYFQSGDSA